MKDRLPQMNIAYILYVFVYYSSSTVKLEISGWTEAAWNEKFNQHCARPRVRTEPKTFDLGFDALSTVPHASRHGYM